MADDEKPQDEKRDDPKMVTHADDGLWEMDLDAFAPKPQGHIVVKKVRYPIYHFMDVVIDDSLRVARLSEDIVKADEMEERIARSIEQLLMLNGPAELSGAPRLTQETFKRVSPRQIITLTVMASTTARVPLMANRTESGDVASSPSPSPALVASTDGGQESSAA